MEDLRVVYYISTRDISIWRSNQEYKIICHCLYIYDTKTNAVYIPVRSILQPNPDHVGRHKKLSFDNICNIISTWFWKKIEDNDIISHDHYLDEFLVSGVINKLVNESNKYSIVILPQTRKEK